MKVAVVVEGGEEGDAVVVVVVEGGKDGGEGAHDNSIDDNNIRSIYYHENGDVWFGTETGISKLSTDGLWTNYNSNSIGICIIGNFMNTLPNTLAISKVKELIACGVTGGWTKPNYTLKGHRDASSTDCPGNTLYAEIKKWPNYG